MLNKDVTHSKMRRKIVNPRILLLDCPLEYKKGESQTNLELSKEEDFATVLAMEEEYVRKMCEDIIKFKPDLVVTEKGLSGKLLSPPHHTIIIIIVTVTF
jgi:T-complex protein 1 subunit gamma